MTGQAIVDVLTCVDSSKNCCFTKTVELFDLQLCTENIKRVRSAFPPSNLSLTAFQASKQNLINLQSSYLHHRNSLMSFRVTLNKGGDKQMSRQENPLVEQKSNLR